MSRCIIPESIRLVEARCQENGARAACPPDWLDETDAAVGDIDTGINGKLIHLLGLPVCRRDPCPRGPVQVCKHATDPDVFRCVRRSCCCWHCPPCSARVKFFRAVHFGRCLVDRGRPLFSGWIDSGRWKSWETAITRSNRKAEHPADRVSYVRVRPEPDQSGELLVTTLPARKLARVSLEQALDCLGQTILAIAAAPVNSDDERRYRPINHSQDWSIPAGRPSKWQPIMELTTQRREDVLVLLDRDGVYPEVSGPRNRLDPAEPVWGIAWRSRDWNPESSSLLQLSCK